VSSKVLLVNDNLSLLNTIYYNLSRQDYQVFTANDGYSGLETARKEQPDLIILDLSLPDLDGLEICRILRQETIVPILLLADKNAKVDQQIDLRVWIDDYVLKPFTMRDFLTRVKTLLLRVSFMREELSSVTKQGNLNKLELGDLVINQVRCEVTRNGEPLRLKPKEYDLLVFLALNQGIALSRDHILERVWGWDYKGGRRTVDVHVRWLREKIENDPALPTRIATVRGVGYRFEA
jgi:DNA-binding response OmpR family regulator